MIDLPYVFPFVPYIKKNNKSHQNPTKKSRKAIELVNDAWEMKETLAHEVKIGQA